ncbi:hypothetical protein BZG36_02104 [Bifiguratus adelaidae]|uniref:Unsaturated glucuronyl hydrolase n=1 Tax=Bifiguratus adelaidae TaxID=1938954 RepID=A0A261Y369_9FUNG|nr:hypothetical protein BZG36_02104 [Bifiguratus adelaidae]
MAQKRHACAFENPQGLPRGSVGFEAQAMQDGQEEGLQLGHRSDSKHGGQASPAPKMVRRVFYLSAALILALSPASAKTHEGQAPTELYSDNVGARIWRTALHHTPTIGDSTGWPEYTWSNFSTPKQPSSAAGTYINFNPSTWTSGFFPSSLWALYQRMTDSRMKDVLARAQAWSRGLAPNVNLTNTHDIAMPFEYDLTMGSNSSELPVVSKMSMNLASRFVPAPGVIRSWDKKGSHNDSVLVIIDNMMNLGLLVRSALTYTKNETLLQMAISHANKTMENHVRPDGSSFHVVDYSATTGQVYDRVTAQGLANNSTWSRGQAWGIYGFAMMYNYTRFPAYLETSRRMADYYLTHLPADGVPYWDFDAPNEPNVTPRDTSSAMIASSGLLLLSTLQSTPVPNNYSDAALKLLSNTINMALADPIGWPDAQYPATGINTDPNVDPKTNTTRGFEAILQHATIDNTPLIPASSRNWDTGLVYGDYYMLEAGNRAAELGLASCSGPRNHAKRT